MTRERPRHEVFDDDLRSELLKRLERQAAY